MSDESAPSLLVEHVGAVAHITLNRADRRNAIDIPTCFALTDLLEQLDRDRYECYRWAMKETGFDPSAAEVPPHRRVRVVTGPPPAVSPRRPRVRVNPSAVCLTASPPDR